ncbi:hypothetical protein BDN67DRAFT_985127 [Paxillus ammoniavirescens]|nr:hypothetical protein BDN67DRAFT_985127 [Paxillus ammoniavirescens]
MHIITQLVQDHMSHWASTTRYNGLSKTVSSHGFRGRTWCTRELKSSKQAEHLQDIDEHCAAEVNGISAEDQSAADCMFADQNIDVLYDPLTHNANPGHEYESDSDEGNEFSGLMTSFTEHRCKDTRDRQDRHELQTHHWTAQMPCLVDAYLAYCSQDSGDGMPAVDEPPADVRVDTPGSIVRIELVDLFSRRSAALAVHPHHVFPNENLIYHGYLGCSPAHPTVAVSICTLSDFRQAHRVCARFTIQAQCKMLCHLHHSLYGATLHEDSRVARSDFWLSKEYIDKFQYEVKAQTTRVATNDDSDDWETEMPVVPDLPSQFNCVDQWCNAGPDQRKKMFAVFHESGIFIATAKYPLAMVDRLLSVYRPNGGLAYDIGCAFAKTIDWHPMYIQGTGNTEGEGCEHIFSSSNELARGTRHASRFHWHQAIEQHFAFWNEDKYKALTRFIWNHYREATNTISTLTAELAVIKATFQLTDEDFPHFHAEECAYLESLKQPACEDQLAIHYVQVLDDLEAHNVPEGNPNTIYAAINHAHIQVDLAYSKLQNAEALTAHLQTLLGLEAPWQVGCEEYNCYKEEASLAKYHNALGDLERLVVMHLFELSKLSMSGTGYKLRQQISKALQRRSEAVRKVITRYNTQAAALNPLCEFDLLRHLCTDIQDHQWSKPAICEATAKVITELLEFEHFLGLELQRSHHPRAAVNAVHLHHLDQIEKLHGYTGHRGIGVRLEHVLTTASELPSGEQVPTEGSHHGGESPQLSNGRPFDSDVELRDEIHYLYQNDLGDGDLAEQEEDVATMENMADFLYDIFD